MTINISTQDYKQQFAVWRATLFALSLCFTILVLPTLAANQNLTTTANNNNNNSTSQMLASSQTRQNNTITATVNATTSRVARRNLAQEAGNNNSPVDSSLQSTKSISKTAALSKSKRSLGDPIGLDTALESQKDLTPAAGEKHKKYILVKKKPKHKKIKMEVYKPKMKYKKIKMKVPVKKMKKKKVKGYLVKKEKHHHEY